MTREDLLHKIEWEGGLFETIAGYGLSHEYVPEEIREDWKKLEGLVEKFEELGSKIVDILEE